MKQSPIHLHVFTLFSSEHAHGQQKIHSRLRDLCDEIESLFHTFITDNLARVDPGIVGLSIESEDIDRVLAGNSDKVPTRRPSDIGRINFNPPDDISSLPIPKHDEASTPRSKQCSSMNTLDCPGTRRLDESGTFFESSKDSNLGFPFLHSIGVGVAGPGKRGSGTESLVSPGEGSVDDILAVSADGDKSAVGTVLETLGIDFGGAEISERDLESLAVLDRLTYSVSAWVGNSTV
jgi:hypothetical protein